LGETEVEFTYTGVMPGEPEDAIQFAEGVVYFEEESANVGEYPMLFDASKFSSTNYEVIAVENTGAKFTITPATLTVNWNAEADGFTKVYGGEDPEFKATADNLVIDGAIDADIDAIIAQTVIARASDDEAVGKYDLTLSADEDADPSVFANYDVTFGTAAEAFEITQAAIVVSIKPQTKVYDGVAVADFEAAAEDLVITNLTGGDIKADELFTKLPTVKATNEALNVGEYEITLSGAEAADYSISYLPSTFTITPAPLTFEFTPQQIQVGEDVEDAIDATAFTVTGLVAEADGDIFSVDVNEDYQDFDGKITADPGTYADGLVIVTSDEAMAANYSGWEEAAGELLVIAAETIVLDDKATVVTEEAEGATVTFESRSINVGNWNVMVLPFDASVAQISNAFGYAAVDILNPEADSKGNVHFMITTSGVIEAGTPFIVKTTDDEGLKKSNFNEVTFTGVDIKKFDGENTSVSDDAGNQFIGTFQETKIWGQNSRYMSGGAWYDARNFTESKPVTIKPLRAYVVTVNPKARIFIEEPDGTVTAIDAVNFNNAINGEAIYNLNGVKVNNINRKGVFIQNGKKVVK
ncbi:MAG: hypothetical protein J6Q22_20085, partial [Prevotella sp.]|nr:hypothetical protein [Prevotella sp.]